MKPVLLRFFLSTLVALLLLFVGCSSDPGATNGSTNGNDTNDPDCGDEGDCLESCEPGFANCDGDPATGCETDLTSPEHCGSCHNVCESDERNLAPRCGEQGQCTVDEGVCLEGFVNLNGRADDGCECEITDPSDRPDDQGLDENCDGVDGTIGHAVFVSVVGSDENDGLTPEAPVATLNQGLLVAMQEGRDYLLVARGTYFESVVLREGIDIYGGYNRRFSERDPAKYPVRIQATGDSDTDPLHLRTVIADEIAAETTLDALIIAGFDGDSQSGTAGASSYALWVRNSNGLQVRGSRIEAGAGVAGSDGEPGEEGSLQSCDAFGGAGGHHQGSTCSAAAGGDGSAGGSPAIDGKGGAPGQNSCVAGTEPCPSSQSYAQRGEDGGDGQNGADAQPANSSPGQLLEGMWEMDSLPTLASDGDHGTGGGGGGQGGACGTEWGTSAGGYGGRGGDGGCGGLAGENGQHGGASFGVLSLASAFTLSEVEIVAAPGGAGGEGGVGGQGAPPDNSVRTTGIGTGGQGGEGGAGGDGGRGADGCGGASFALAYLGFEPTRLDVSFGAAPAPAAGGCEGVVEQIHGFTN